jgi:hypothetical protein
VSVSVLVIALLLAGIQARASSLIGSGLAKYRSAAGTLAAWMILAASLSNLIWAFRAWPWYWALGCLIGLALVAALLVTRRSSAFWLAMRPLVAAATSASAGLLWVAYPPAR